MTLSNLYVLTSVSVSAVVEQPDLIFRPAAEAEAATWLQERADMDDVVLASYQTGNYLGARAGVRVVVGHWAETIAFEEKKMAVEGFFGAEAADSERRALLARHDVDFVWWGPRERELGGYDPGTSLHLRPVYDKSGIMILAVESLQE